jgi:F-type H+-transporting ATPase subunit gamma
MSDSLEVLRRQLGSTKDLKSVVRAMKAISAAGLSQYEKSVLSLRAYYRTVRLGLRACLEDNALAQAFQHSGKASGVIVVFGSDQGLVGQFNEILADYVRASVSPANTALVWAVGERMAQCLEDRGFHVVRRFPLPASIESVASLIVDLLNAIRELEKSEGWPELIVCRHSPRHANLCEPAQERVLPFDDKWIAEIRELKWPTPLLPETIGAAAQVFDALVREYVFVCLFQGCVESLASENASRLMAMQRAEENIDKLSGELTSRFHRLRQSSIDEELFDVVSGFEALKGRGR